MNDNIPLLVLRRIGAIIGLLLLLLFAVALFWAIAARSSSVEDNSYRPKDTESACATLQAAGVYCR